jgi:uncharacterized protein (TIGR02145 family)
MKTFSKNPANLVIMSIMVLTMAFIFSCSSDDGGGGNAKSDCIENELKIGANTLDDVAKACGAIRSEVLSQLSDNVGGCNKNNLSFDKSISNIKSECGVSEIPVVNPSSSSNSNSGNGNSSPSGGKGNNIANYKTKKIGEQTWMAENLNYAVAGSECYDFLESNCDKYGRLYDWAIAMDFPANCNEDLCASQILEKHRGICPSGWHIPNDDEWDVLIKYVDPNWISNSNNVAGTKLKAKSGWDNTDDGQSGNGEDKFDFAALPGGACDCGCREKYEREHNNDYDPFYNIGKGGQWWSSSAETIGGVDAKSAANSRGMRRSEAVNKGNGNCKNALFSVRCVKD